MDAEMPEGHFGKDSLFVTIFSPSGDLLKIFRIEPENQAERFYVEELLILSDTTIAVAYSANDCDTFEGAYGYLEVYHISGEFLWRIYSHDLYLLRLAYAKEDGNIAWFEADADDIVWSDHGNVLTISGLTGEIMSSVDLPGNAPEYIIGVPGADEMIIAREDQLQLVRLNNTTGDYEIVLSKPFTFPWYFGSVIWHDDEYFYTEIGFHPAIITVDRQLDTNTVISFEVPFSDFIVRHDTLLVLDYADQNHYKITSYDTAGNLLSTFTSVNDGVRMEQISLSENGVMLFGAYGSGPHNSVPVWHHTERHQAMCSYFPGAVFQHDPDSVSLRVTNIFRTEDLTIQKHFTTGHNYTGDVYDFEGGDFYVEIENDGEVPIQSFWLNTVFDFTTNYNRCPPKISNNRYYDSFFLPPGEKIIVHFGAVKAFHQLNLPAEFCFWPSGPNRSPDDMPTEDVFCIEGIVATDDPVVQDIFISPNPANEEIYISCEENNQNLTYDLMNNMGQVVAEGSIEAGNTREKIQTQDLLPGLYFLKLGGVIKKIIISH
jgi:hypothetical protein